MKRRILILLLFLKTMPSFSQNQEMEMAVEKIVQNRLDALEDTDDARLSEDLLTLHWSALYKSPVDVNLLDEKELQTQLFVNPIQAHSLIQYRSGVGYIQNLHELQGIPGWDNGLVKLLFPFIVVGNHQKLEEKVNEILTRGNQTLQIRAQRFVQEKKGFLKDTTGVSPFGGSKWGRVFRYGYSDGKTLKFGFQGELDAGEKWHWKKEQLGMDFYGAYFSITPQKSWLKKMVLGNFTVNLGQGLMLWQTYGAYKGNDVLMIKNQNKGIEPYRSVGEGVGFKGMGFEASKGNLQLTFFISQKKEDAKLEISDSSEWIVGYRPLLTGLHRTTDEMETRNKIQKKALGYALTLAQKKYSLSVNHVVTAVNFLPIRSEKWYDKFDRFSKWQNNIGIDFTINLGGNHFFGETMVDQNGAKGIWVGIIGSLSKEISISGFYRKLDRGLYSISGSVPTEYGGNKNEDGFFIGIKMTTKRAAIDGYIDLFRSRWLRYGIHAPSNGTEWLFCGNFKSSDRTELQIRVKNENKPQRDYDWAEPGIKPWINNRKTSIRFGFTSELNEKSTIKLRVEMVRNIIEKSNKHDQGQIVSFEMKHLCFKKKLKLNAWVCYSEVSNADVSLFVFEPDPVSGSTELISYYYNGLRWGLSSVIKIHKMLKISLKFAESLFQDRRFQGAGLDQIVGKKKSELGLGAVINW
jgi:hypothetical protein